MAATNTGPAAPYSQEDIDWCLQALVAWAGNSNAAHTWLEAHAEGRRVPSKGTLINWRKTLHWERYEQLREQWGSLRERAIANDMRDVAAAAVDAQMLAVERAKERLEADRDSEPARTAAALAKVGQVSVDKLLSLTGRPTTITENRNVNEILRSLVAKGVLALPDEPAQIEGSVGGDD